MSGQGNGPLPRAALCSKKWIKTPYDLVNVMHSHLLEQHNITKVHFRRTFFSMRCSTIKPKTIFMKQFFTLIATAMAFTVAGWSQTVVDIIAASDDHNILELAVGEANLVDTLQGDGPFTVFAPTDAAFAALLSDLGVDQATLLALPQLAAVLTYHVAGVNAPSSALSDGEMVLTLNGQEVTVTIDDDVVMINNATVTVSNETATNGVVHVIDAVLLPDGCTDATACNYDANAYPDDGSCILPGDTCDDGVDTNVEDTVGDDCVCAGIPATVVDIIVASDDHAILESAVGQANLVATLQGDGPFTVFAPTDAAFAALLSELAVDEATLLALPELAAVLTYHVAGVEAMSSDLTDGQAVMTVNGQDVVISIVDDVVTINGTATVTVADLEAGNGVVHVIDAVLLPDGCTDATACNYDDNAYPDDGSCILPGATCDDGDWLTENDTISADCACAGAAIEFESVLDIVVASPIHESLEAAVLQAGLDGALADGDSLTVFAPTDEAFDTLMATLNITTAELLALPNLSDILQYHVVGAVAMSTDLSDGQSIATLQGASVDISINMAMDTVMVNDAMVILANLTADNGVVHVIDKVLLPPTPDNLDEVVSNWSVMPNPANEFIVLNGVAPEARIAMIDLTGRTVREFAQGTTMLSVGDMPRGTYLLTVTEGRNIQTKKVMVQ